MLSPKTRGLDEFKGFIDNLQRNMRGVATEEITWYLLGNEKRGYKYYPPYTDQKTRKRTYKLRFAWMMRGRGVQARAENAMPYAGVAQGIGSKGWRVGSAKTGYKYKKFNWRNIDQINQTNIAGACRAAEQAIVRKTK